jgi:hypothetical protein
MHGKASTRLDPVAAFHHADIWGLLIQPDVGAVLVVVADVFLAESR